MDKNLIIAVVIIIIIIILIVLFTNRIKLQENYSNLGGLYKDDKIIFFYRENCIHCNNMKSEWIKFRNSSNKNIVEVDISKHPNIANEYNINGVPHIIKIKSGIITEFNGPRTAKELENF
jgi:thioredoxin-related protein